MRFKYLLDPVFLSALTIYLINKLVLKPHTQNVFVHGYVADIICLPLWVPVLVLTMRMIGLRDHDDPPRAHEILIPLIVWSLAFEVILPQTASLGRHMTADPMDVLSYTGGALMAAVAWRMIYPPSSDKGQGRT